MKFSIGPHRTALNVFLCWKLRIQKTLLGPLHFLHLLSGGCGTRLSIRRQDPKNHFDAETRGLVYICLPSGTGHFSRCRKYWFGYRCFKKSSSQSHKEEDAIILPNPIIIRFFCPQVPRQECNNVPKQVHSTAVTCYSLKYLHLEL